MLGLDWRELVRIERTELAKPACGWAPVTVALAREGSRKAPVGDA